MKDLISRQAAIDNIRGFQLQLTCDFLEEWMNGMDEGFKHAVDVIELMETADAIPVEFIKSEIKENKGFYNSSLRRLLDEWSERKEE